MDPEGGILKPKNDGRFDGRFGRFSPLRTMSQAARISGSSESGKWNATPLFLALVVVEVMDLVFAVDSVPAVLAVTRNPFVAYSSNVFAVLGLRAMYFALAAVLPRFRFLQTGLAAILIFIRAKMVGGKTYRCRPVYRWE